MYTQKNIENKNSLLKNNFSETKPNTHIQNFVKKFSLKKSYYEKPQKRRTHKILKKQFLRQNNFFEKTPNIIFL